MNFSDYRNSSEVNEDSYSSSDDNGSKSSVSIQETESDESHNESSIIVQKRKSKPKRVICTDSEDSDDAVEREIEREAVSPRTRRSIVGYRPASLTSEEDDIEDDSEKEMFEDKSSSSKAHSSDEDAEEQIIKKQVTSRTQSSSVVLLTDDDDENVFEIAEAKNENQNRYASTNSSTPINKKSSTNREAQSNENKILKNSQTDDEFMPQSHFSDEEEELHSFDPENNIVKHVTDGSDKQISPRRPRSSSYFNASIKNRFCSTINEDVLLTPVKNDQKPEIVDKSTEVIEISCSPDITAKKAEVQPKITSAFQQQQNPSVPITALERTKVVSEEYFNKEMKKLQDLRSELGVCQNLINTVGSNLPDKGVRMSERTNKLKLEIKRQAEYISTLVIDQNLKTNNILTGAAGPTTALKAPSWDELQAVTNAIQSKYTGKQALAAFTAQKVITIDRLKDIHGSLETCPDENVLADDPKSLKTPLMKHQKHALAWMNWREKQKPRGGILADDMGLGKTLTMISLVLYSIEREEIEEDNEEESDEDDSDNKNDQWNIKGRRNYYNGGTLVVCPASLIRQWESEVQNRTVRNSLSVIVHHGKNREEKARRLAKYDMVITTYAIATKDFRGVLGDIKWDRIILDEAHVIRNHKTLTSTSVCELRAKSRWALTGTPIQNREVDLYAIIKFLRCTPFDDLAHWKKWIDNKSAGGQQRLNTLMKSLMLRRTKVQLQENGALKPLPQKKIELVEIELEKDEMNVYQKVLIYSQSLFAEFLKQRADKNSLMSGDLNAPQINLTKQQKEDYHKIYKKLCGNQREEVKQYHILILLLRLRQICCHPGLIDSMLEDGGDLESVNNSNDTNQREVNLIEQLERLEIADEAEISGNSSAIAKTTSKLLSKNNPVFNLNHPSSKIKKILKYIDEKILKTNDKAIIVSQWVSFLNIIKCYLSKKNIDNVSLDGSIPVSKRNDIVTLFNDPKSHVKIMLLSLTAGGVGLNLVGANHLLLIDLHWNPQLEAQASDRIYRVGQEKPVFIYKFLCKNTIEERIKALQDHKLSLANEVLTGVKTSSGSKLTIDDLKNLFGL